jgi:hypothetical protein
MRRRAFAGLALAAAGLCAIGGGALAAPALWSGRYVYTSDSRPDAGGSPIVLDYDLTLKAGAPAVLAIEGFQADETLLLDAETRQDGALALKFRSFGDGRLVNTYGVALYRPGAVMLVLERRSDGVLLTQWKALQPPFEDLKRDGVYFRLAR